jgi:hypothetical protein
MHMICCPGAYGGAPPKHFHLDSALALIPLLVPAGRLAGFGGQQEPQQMRRVPLCLHFLPALASLQYPLE